MIWLKAFTVAAMAMGAWQSFRAMGKPVRRQGKYWYRQPEGTFRRWYGGRARTGEELGPPEE